MKLDSLISGKKILIVDDEPELRKAISFDFQRRGCIIFEAPSGIIALEMVKRESPDIVVSDVRMPNGNGVDLLKEIRKIHPNLPIVLLVTGFADLTEEDALKMGAYALIEKPIDRKKMISILELAITG